MSMRCLAVMCHAPAPTHHRLLPLANSCLTLFPNPRLPPCAIPYLTTDTLSILTILAFHHSPYSLSIPLSFPHPPSPILATFTSMTCVLKRFPLTSPRKLPLTCVKRGFLRTAEPHRTSQLSPCAPLMSQCHVHAVPGSDVPCPCTTAPSASPARELLSCLCVLTPHLPPWAIAHLIPTHFPSSPYSLSITLTKHLPSLCRFHTRPLQL